MKFLVLSSIVGLISAYSRQKTQSHEHSHHDHHLRPNQHHNHNHNHNHNHHHNEDTHSRHHHHNHLQTKSKTKGGPPFYYDDFYSDGWTSPDCVDNTRPSPVNLVVDDDSEMCDTDFNFQFSGNDMMLPFHFENNGHTLEAKGHWVLSSFGDGPYYVEYQAAQFHFHSPSEHTINGEHADLEMHIVHNLKPEYQGLGADSVLVVSFLFNEDDDSEDTDEFFLTFDPSNSCKVGECEQFPPSEAQFSDFVPSTFEVEEYYAYKGSFTTPPCSPIAQWVVNAEVLPINHEFLESFQEHWSDNPDFANNEMHYGEEEDDYVGNNRPIQGDIKPIYFEKC